MAHLVIMNANLVCTFGAAPSTLVITHENLVNAVNKPAATIMDNVPMKNIMPFGMCTSLANPQVSAATSSAMGVLTPMPCLPVIPAPWAPGSPTVMIKNRPALNNTSKCVCTWAGVISVTVPGQFTVNGP